MDPCLGLVASQHDAGALNASASWFFVLMTIPRAQLCCATDSCQHVIVFGHRPRPMSFRVSGYFVLIFILHRNANVLPTHLFCWLLPQSSEILLTLPYRTTRSALLLMFARFGVIIFLCFSVDRSHSVFLTVSKTPLRHDRFVPNPFLFMIHIHGPYQQTGI